MRCNIHDCTEPRCPESEFWCKRHYIRFRAAGMADLNASAPRPPAPSVAHKRRQFERVMQASIRRRIRPFEEREDE